MSELPFLKNKNKNQGAGGVIERTAMRTSEDNQMHDDLMDQVASELLQAIETKNVKLLREALSALVLHIQDMDEKSDQEEMPE